MSIYTLTFQTKKKVAEGTMMFFFTKPENFTFQPGQFITMRLPDIIKKCPRDGMRVLSIASAPEEEYLAFAWRRSDSVFKKTMDMLVFGDKIEMIGPSGQSTIADDASVTFLIGGIGITPVRSILVSDHLRDNKRAAYLFYSNRTPQSAPFFDEITKICDNKTVLINTMTDVTKNWSGEKGFITAMMIRKYVDNIDSMMYYIVGTSGFVHAMESVCTDIGVAQEKIISDNFG